VGDIFVVNKVDWDGVDVIVCDIWYMILLVEVCLFGDWCLLVVKIVVVCEEGVDDLFAAFDKYCDWFGIIGYLCECCLCCVVDEVEVIVMVVLRERMGDLCYGIGLEVFVVEVVDGYIDFYVVVDVFVDVVIV